MKQKRNLRFKVITEDEFRKFSNNNEQSSFMQSVELGNLKKKSKIVPHYVGVYEEKNLVGATLILEQPSFLGYKTFYAPRGALINYYDFDLLKFFFDELSKYVKKRKCYRIIIDPNVIYQVRTSDGVEIPGTKNNQVISNLKNVGFEHFGFNNYFETLQTRWAYILKLDEDYDTIKNRYCKSTRKNIDSCYKKGLRVRKGTEKDLNVMSEIFDLTSKRKNFNGRTLSYYKDMYETMHDLMTIYIAYIDPDIYYECSLNNLEEERKNNELINKKMEVDMVGSKLINQKNTSDKLIVKYENELEKAKKFKEENPNGKDIGVLLSLKSGREYLTLTSGILVEYKDFTPKYSLYDQHIKDAIDDKYEYVNFYGITGDFDKNSEYYGMYEFKKGFSGNVIELVGQFEKKIGLVGLGYNLFKKIKRK